MKKRHVYIAGFLVASSIALAVPFSASAHRGGSLGGCGEFAGMHRGAEMHGGSRLPRFLRGLDLTESQRDKIFEILHAQAPAMREKAKIVHDTRTQLHALAQAPEFDAKRAKDIADASAKAMSEMALMRAEAGNKIHALLTPEQRKQLEERKTRFKERHRQGGGDDARESLRAS